MVINMVKEYFKLLFKFIKKYWIILLILSLYILITYLLGVCNCILKLITGIPCPGCGMTRACISILRFDFVQAFKYNPLVFILPFIAWVIIFNERPIINKIYKNNIFWIVVLLLVVSTYILRFIFVYPDIPMDYYDKNLFKAIYNFLFKR